MYRDPRENEARYLWFTLHPLRDLIYIPHLLAHALSSLDTGSPTILYGWDATTSSTQQICDQTFGKYTLGVSRSQWREIEFFCKKFYQHLANG